MTFYLPEKVLCRSKKYATAITNYEKKEILPLTDEEIKSYNNKKIYHICKTDFNDVDDSNNDSNDDSNDDNNG